MASKSSKVYTSSFSEYDKAKADAIRQGTFKYDFFSTKFKGAEDYFDQLKTDDIISKLSGMKPKGAKVKEWSPQKVEGLHAAHLERAMRVRYANYNSDGISSVETLYGLSATHQQDQSSLAKKFDKFAFKWA